jgi:DNA-3-methyladenine glycosylase
MCAGPGRLCQALGVTDVLDGCSIVYPPFRIEPRVRPVHVVSDQRIGITRGTETPWRFMLAGSPYVSRPARRIKKAKA